MRISQSAPLGLFGSGHGTTDDSYGSKDHATDQGRGYCGQPESMYKAAWSAQARSEASL